jgi:phosphoglycerate dehydrogenase-like enzyme
MTWTVLAPVESRVLFDRQPLREAQVAFYEMRSASLAQRALRKLGWLDDERILADMLELFECEDCLREVKAIWLSKAYVPPSYLACLFDQLPELKWVYSQKAGTEHLDLDFLRSRGVKVSNNGQLSSRRVAEMALASIFAQAKQLPEHVALQRRRRWRSLQCDDLSRQTVGIIGTGNVGNELARLCRAVGLRVIGATRDLGRSRADATAYDRLFRLEDELDEMLGEADYVVLTLPLTGETRGLIGAERLSRMKSDATLVNVARGALVDEGALCRALRRGALGAAYIDCPTRMPPAPWSQLYRTPNLVVTHYSSVNSPRATQDALDQFRAGLEQLQETGEPPNRVA